MLLLLLVSFIWAISFGLIGRRLAGVDPTAVATLRLVLALLVFLPFFRFSALRLGTMLRLIAIGAIQFGAMYLFYQRSYLYLPSYAVALFVIPMPLYVTAAAAIAEKKWSARYVIAALLAFGGSGVVTFQGGLHGNFFHGFVLMQLSNLCFAIGQIAWRSERKKLPTKLTDSSLFALPYIGAVITCLLASVFLTDWSSIRPTTEQWMVLIYLGVVSSGLCFFWWNLGATQVTAGKLAVMNNAKVPLAIACSLLFFGETANLSKLAIALVLMAGAIVIADGRIRKMTVRRAKPRPAKS